MFFARLRESVCERLAFNRSVVLRRAAIRWQGGLASVFATVIFTAAPLGAASWSWSLAAGQLGDWSAASNWSGALPTSGDTTYIVNGGTATITTMTPVCGTLSLGGSTGSGTVQMTGGELAGYNENIGDAGVGTFTQSAGTNNSSGGFLHLGNGTSGSGAYILSGGQVSAYYEYLGYSATGSFTQSGGTNNVSTFNSAFQLGAQPGSCGTYDLSGSGQLLAYYEYVGYYGTGTFTQSGGDNSLGYKLVLGYNASSSGWYGLSGSGQLSATREEVGRSGTGSFTQTGGTNSVTSDALYVGLYPFTGLNGSSGTYSLSGNSLLLTVNTYVGDNSTGVFSQTGGTHSIAQSLDIGDAGIGRGTGAYYLSGSALLSAGNEYVGGLGVGSFWQSGGVNWVTGTLYVSSAPVGGSIYNLSGSGQLSASNESVGYSASGSFTQSGGTNSISGTLDLNALGTYNLDGGLLVVSAQSIRTSSQLSILTAAHCRPAEKTRR